MNNKSNLPIPKILPPVGLLITAISMILLKQLAIGNFDLPFGTILMWIFIITALYLDSSAILLFLSEKTGIIPFRKLPTTLVTTGIYRYTRNPMYLGMVFWLLAWFCYLQTVLAAIPVILFIFWIQKRYIKQEEQILTDLFGAEFTQYCSQTRRWI